MAKNWFRNQKNGLGWSPSSFEGWATIFVYILLIVLMFSYIDGRSSSVSDTLISFIPQFIILSIVLLIIINSKKERGG